MEKFISWLGKTLIGALSGAAIALTWIANTNFKLATFEANFSELRAAQAQTRREREVMTLDVTREMGAMETRIIEKLGDHASRLESRIYHLEKVIDKKLPEN